MKLNTEMVASLTRAGLIPWEAVYPSIGIAIY